MAIPDLPRELLWTDKKDISEFMQIRLGNNIVSATSIANFNIKNTLGDDIMLKLYNEAFYHSIRVVYEHDSNARPQDYMEKILTELDDKELASYTICLMFHILLLQSDKSKEILQFIEKLQKEYINNFPAKLLNWFNKAFKPLKNNLSYSLIPYPCPADILQESSLDWTQITQGFSKQVIIGVLDLWDNNNEKSKVIKLIEQAYTSCLSELKNDEFADRADEEFFIQKKAFYAKAKNDVKFDTDKGGRPQGKTLDELFTETCPPAQRGKFIEVVRSLKGKEAVFALRVAASENVNIIKQVPSHSKVLYYFPNIGASSGYYKYKQEGIVIKESEKEYYKRLLLLKDDKS